ncbi:hypothetical protein ZIOFF_062170 [Zingiber officinale]|uniref:Uncharacterized protein n=1 Tax=Zingiber officinale TaxID=94328 RepID=A0A8J5F3S9_ZINOF|nr:hypothetical protein ZIOFF_062170 [Zingiber officinale]
MVQSTLPSNGDPSVSQGTDFDAEKLETNYSWGFGSQLQAVSSLGNGEPIMETGASSLSRLKEIATSSAEGFPHEGSTIKPGVDSEVVAHTPTFHGARRAGLVLKFIRHASSDSVDPKITQARYRDGNSLVMVRR